MPVATAQWLPVDDLLGSFHPLNPVEHGEDVPVLAESLLEAGWVEPIAYNTRNGRIVGGHGRVKACDWLRQQSPEWFEYRFAQWQVNHTATEQDQARFDPFYWNQALCLMVDLNDAEHEAMLIRLNDTESQGKDDPDRLKSLLSALPGRLKAIAGHATPEAQAQPKLDTATETDFQDKQIFERPDATDYRVKDAPEPDTADHFSGDVEEYQDDDEIDPGFIEEEEEEEERTPKAPPPVRALSVSLTWAQWKQWNNWKRENNIAKDTDAFVQGHEAYASKDEEIQTTSQ